ncbi:MAG TPA: AraC family transcriptional regulator [Puia sp.]|jgi:two-component system response regulator YesN
MSTKITLTSAELRQIQRAINYIDKVYTDYMTVELLTTVFEMTPPRLQAGFKHLTGFTVQKYIISVRIEKAKVDLANPHFAIIFVHRKHGFSSHRYFAKVFKQYTGLTCQEYRFLQAQKKLD